MKVLLSFAILLLTFSTNAQDSALARYFVDTLTSPYYFGRGYTNKGMVKAADFLAAQLALFGVEPLDGRSYFQKFSYPVNTFPGKMEVAINGRSLVSGRDFIVSPESRGVKADVNLVQKDTSHFISAANHVHITLQDKLTWSVASKVADYTSIQVLKSLSIKPPAHIKIDIENKFVESYKASNICGIVKGTSKPDSVIVLSAHYDHLGGMGSKTYFPGANDNASGVSLLLTLAKYYAANPQPYSIVFILFAGEEAGLIGSNFYTEHPILPLEQIRFLLNVDLVGTGDEGITVVNSTEYPQQFQLLKNINESGRYLSTVNARGKAANSDHYWFTEKGVPSFFIYTLGGIKAYHDVFDKSSTLPLNKYNDLFKLILNFNKELMLNGR